MLALIQQLLTLAFLTSPGFISFSLKIDLVSSVFVAFTGIVLTYAAVLAGEFFFSFRINKNNVSPIGLLTWLRAWSAEMLMGPQIFCWRQPFRTNAEEDFLLGDQLRGRRGVVFVHGLFCNRAFWAPWMSRLRSEGHAFVSVSLEPVFGSIDNYSEQISTAVAKVSYVTQRPVLVVCHSMGGLATKKWLLGTSDITVVHRVVTIATPHLGTWLAKFGHSQNSREMQLGSSWLLSLNKKTDQKLNQLFICWYSDNDNIVFPATNACLDGADNRLVSGFGHVCLAFAPVVVDTTLALLNES